jgi:diaminopimelate epimerase
MKLRFTKMHGQGNDFVVINAVNPPLPAGVLTPANIRHMAHRQFGIGCDQLLVVEPPVTPGTDFRYRIFNNDGGEVEQCGNGSRCFARFVVDQGLTTKKEIRVETLSGIIAPRLNDDGTVTVNMGAPRFAPADIPFDAPQRASEYSLDVGGSSRTILALNMGNPHAVQIVSDVDTVPVREEGPLIEHHVRFPRRVNVGFMQIVARDHIRLRVWERGAGETLACGTGACAAVVTGIQWGKLDARVRISTRGGDLSVAWAGEGQPVFMTGAATTVFESEIELPDPA